MPNKTFESIPIDHPYKSVDDSLKSLAFAFNHCSPDKLIVNNVILNHSLKIRDTTDYYKEYGIRSFVSIIVIAIGKAAGKMLSGLFSILEDKISHSVLILPKGQTITYLNKSILKKTIVIYSSHPLPNRNSLYSSNIVIDLLKQIEKPTIVIFLISGGASSLIESPLSDLTLHDIREVNNFLLMSGASIDEINVIRKHISAIKGGKILKMIHRDNLVIGLLLSDVVGDHLDTIGSGLTSADPSTFTDANNILKKYSNYKIKPKYINKVQKIFELGINNKIDETLKHEEFKNFNVFNHIIGNNSIFCNSIIQMFIKMGYETNYLGSKFDLPIIEYLSIIKNYIKNLNNKNIKSCFVLGGETRLLIPKVHGKGGRNQEFVARLLEYFSNINFNDFSFISIGTDGIDGNSRAAGGIISPQTIKNFKKIFKNKEFYHDYLDKYDSYYLLKKLNSNIITGYTGMNYNDVCIYVINP